MSIAIPPSPSNHRDDTHGISRLFRVSCMPLDPSEMTAADHARPTMPQILPPERPDVQHAECKRAISMLGSWYINSSLVVGQRIVYRIRNAIHVLGARSGETPLSGVLGGRRSRWPSKADE